MNAVAAPAWPARRTTAGLVLGVAAVAAATLVVALVVGGGQPQPAPAGLPDAGAATGWALSLVRLGVDAAGVLVVGQLLAVALLFPAPGGTLPPTSLRALRAAAGAAAVWAFLAAVELPLSYSELAGRPLSQALDPAQLVAFVQTISTAQALVLQAVLGLVVCGLILRVVGPVGAGAVLLLAVLALLPPALAGHSAASGDHMLALSSLTVHLVAVSLWVGGLAALAVAARAGGPLLAPAVRRFSVLAVWCLVAVGTSGLVNAALRVRPLSALVTSGYGVLVLGKAGALALLAGLGWLHRRRTLTALEAGSRSAFARLAAAEMAVMFATIGLAVALAASPPPVDQSPTLALATPARALLGFDLPAAPTVGRLLFDIRLDGFALTAAVLAVALYLAGVRSLARRQVRWPASRTVLWVLGWSLVVLATSSGLGRYAEVLFSAHMAQHMALSMVAPIPLVLAAPITLALRALPAVSARSGTPGVREWLIGALHSRVVKVLSHPVVAAGLFVGSLYALYFTPLFELAMRNHLGHLLMEVHFLAVGGLFFWVLIGPDPAPNRPPHLARVVTLFATLAAHAFFSVALLSGTHVIAQSYYAALARPWGRSLLDDQQLGGGIGWAFGELPVWLVMGALFVQWSRADTRTARRVDRSAGTDHDELVAYNEWLARLGRSESEVGDRGRR